MTQTVIQQVPVIHTVVQQVTPSWFTQLVTLGEIVVPAYVASFLHSIIKSRSTKLQQDEYDWLNSALLFLYALGIALGSLYFQGKLSLHNPDLLVTSFLAAIGTASIRYNVLKLKQPKDTTTETPASVQTTPAEVAATPAEVPATPTISEY